MARFSADISVDSSFDAFIQFYKKERAIHEISAMFGHCLEDLNSIARNNTKEQQQQQQQHQ